MERNEYPRPQFRRDHWQSLNGLWEFEFDDADNGMMRGLFAGNTALKTNILVPYSYQYEASGIGDTTQHNTVWYRRSFVIGKENRGKRALLCFNAADYRTDVWVNGCFVTRHTGGFSPFHADMTGYLKDGENTLVVRCVDPLDNTQPRGKQSWTGERFGCYYIPNTGIWQSVWIEFFSEDCISSYSLQPDVDHCAVYGYIETLHALADELEIVLTFGDKIIKTQRFSCDGRRTRFTVILADNAFSINDMMWWIDRPNLINVDFRLYRDGRLCDEAHTRFGMRKISVDSWGKICLNNTPLYQRLILDQGYWPESGLTPPSAEALKKDIILAKAMGFNGARKHQKLEDPYFYYYADELGYLTWCEMPSAYTFTEQEMQAVICEWQEILAAAKNFTSVVAYVPLNECWGAWGIQTDKRQQNFAKSLYDLTRAVDDTRLVSTNDGFGNIEDSDILSIHDYDIRRAEDFPVKYHGGYDGMYPQSFALLADGHRYKGQPVLLTEFGGIAFVRDQKGEAWGYGCGAKDADELCARLTELIKGIAMTEFQGYCYTQLTDVQQEVNGLLYFDRTPKVEPKRLKEIFG